MVLLLLGQVKVLEEAAAAADAKRARKAAKAGAYTRPLFSST